MRRNRYSNNIEEQIRNIVNNAVNNRDFQNLNRDIQSSVGNAMSELRNALGMNRGGDSYRKSNNYNTNGDDFHVNFGEKYKDKDEQRKRERSRREVQPTTSTALYPSEPVGRVAGILCTVFGWIFMPITGIAILVLTLVGFLTPIISILGPIALGLLPFFLISTGLTFRGSTIRKRLKRFDRYNAIFHNKSYCNIKDIAAQTLLTNKYIVKDLRRMISLGMFPEAHFDEQNTCIMLNQESYRQYQELQRSIKEKETEKSKTASATAGSAKETNDPKKDSANPALDQAIENGRNYIGQIREANDAIPGEEFSQKLDRLEMVIDKIFTHVEKHPEQLSEIQKFMDYYLPTTLKLVTAYKEFDLQPVQGENIRTAKSEIEATLTTINHAFETLLDSLFEDAALDIATDISVLETLLAQEGLTKDKLKSKEI